MPYDPNDPEFPTIQIDLIGYIIGWGRAVLEDYRNGNLTPSGQYGRIGKGIEYGTAASFAAWLKKISLSVPMMPIENPDPTTNPNPPTDPSSPVTSGLCYVTGDIPVRVSNPESTYFQAWLFYNSSDLKYYTTSDFTYLANGYYIFVDQYESGRYYNIVNGLVVGTGMALLNPFN